MRVVLPGGGASAARHAGKAGRKPIETLGRRWVGRQVSQLTKRARGARTKVRARLPVADLGRAKPRGASSGWQTNPLPERQGLLKG